MNKRIIFLLVTLVVGILGFVLVATSTNIWAAIGMYVILIAHHMDKHSYELKNLFEEDKNL